MEKQIRFRSAGKTLYGMLHLAGAATGKKAPGIVMCHGFTGSKLESHFLFVKAARQLCKAGFAVLRFDFMGSGESEGEFSEMTLHTEINDAREAVRFIERQKGVNRDKLGLIGLSMGGCVAASVAHEFREIRALVLWSALAKPTRINKHIAGQLRKGSSRLEMGAFILGRGFVRSRFEVDPAALIKKYENPVLIIHGTADKAVPVSDSRLFYRSAPGRKKLVLLKGSDHTYSTVSLEKKVIGLTTNWLKKTLR